MRLEQGFHQSYAPMILEVFQPSKDGFKGRLQEFFFSFGKSLVRFKFPVLETNQLEALMTRVLGRPHPHPIAWCFLWKW